VKVLFVVPWGEALGGAERRLTTILRNVDRARVQPRVVFLANGSWVEEVAALGIPVCVIVSGRLRHARRFVTTVRRISLEIRRERPDLIVNWSAKMQLYGGLAAALAGAGDRTIWWQLNISTREWLDRVATLVPARAVACSSFAAAEAQEKLRPRRETFVVHPGIEPPPVASTPALEALRAGLEIPPERTIVGIVGRLQPWKRQHLLLGAVARLVEGGRDVHALVVGGTPYGFSPDYPAQLRRLVDDRGLDGRATFTDHVDEPGPYVQLMDVFVNASAAEPFGIVLLEAMALARPVVAYDRGGPREIVESGVSGLLLPEGGETGLADALDELVRDPALRRRLGEAGRARFEDLFTAERMVARLTEEFERLHGRGASTGRPT